MSEESKVDKKLKKEQKKKDKKANKDKGPVLRWRGILDGIDAVLRRIIASIVVMLGVLLMFIQLSFIHLEFSSEVTVYLMPLLILTALGSLLLGTRTGTFIGLILGSVLLLHAQYQPLDYYELLFVRFISSVVMLTVSGFFFGINFALVLRRGYGPVKRGVHLFISSLLVSILYTLVFSVHAFFALLMRIVEASLQEISETRLQAMVASTLTSLGDIGLQILLDALIITVCCLIAYKLVRNAEELKGSMTIRMVFGSWLGVVVLLLYMASVAVNAVVIYENERADSETDFRSEVNYLCLQQKMNSFYAEKFARFVEEAVDDDIKLETAPFYDLQDYLTGAYLLDGYSLEEDGTILEFVNSEYSATVLYGSDDPRFTMYSTLEEDFPNDMVVAIQRSLENGTLERFAYNETEHQLLLADNYPELEVTEITPEIYYLYAKQLEVANYEHSRVTYMFVMMQPSDMVFSRRTAILGAISLCALVLMIGTFAIVFILLNRVVAENIDEENQALALICEGKLDTRATAGGTREFESLSDGINTTVNTLKEWIREAETRMDAELATAKAIQESQLPGIFPPYPDIIKFDIYASMQAAKEVGGDFYDFFLIGDGCDSENGKLAFVIADVSGKGVPGAMLMMKAKSQIRNYLGSGMELGEAIEEVNRQIMDGNEEGMFLTAWVGVLDYGTGHVEYVNCGHNPPLLWRQNGGWTWMRKRSGPMLGVFDVPFRAQSIDCDPGDTFLLYTDGVTEAFDVHDEMYGEDRLLEVAHQGYKMHPRELLELVRGDVKRHALGAEQSDDITILTLEVGVPPEITATLEVPATIDELDRVNEFLHTELNRRLCPTRVQTQLDIAVEELFTNVCWYAYAGSDEPGTVRIQRTYSTDPTSITVDIIDTGVPFNPLEKPDAVTPGRIEDVPIGGLGILMTKKCVDEISYEYNDGCNMITIVKRW